MIVVGLGGNIGDEVEIRARFAAAREALGQLDGTRSPGSASLYRSAPVGPEQPAFLNTAVRLQATDVQPGELIATLLEIERRLGRERDREVRWGPRPIDLDVLVWDTRVLATPELCVPHPRLCERRFALAPLVDLVGEAFEIPGVGRAGDALARVRDQVVELVAECW